MPRIPITLILTVTLWLPAAGGAQEQRSAPLNFSGVLFANYQWQSDSAARSNAGGQPPNRFDLQRVYLTFRMPAGERTSVRVTADMYQQGSAPANAYYTGWAVRLKYAYLERQLTQALAGVDGLVATARLGMIHNVVIDQIDSHWPRWLGVNALETHGYFASADVGAAGILTLPRRRGEIYMNVVNGNGYAAAETDRFKDAGVRVSITPFATDSGFLRSFSITPWVSLGATASQFVRGGAGQLGAVGEGLRRDRGGVFMGLRDRRLTAGTGVSRRVEGIESGANTFASPRQVRTRTGRLIHGFALIRPLEIANPSRRSNLGLIGRYDRFRLDQAASGTNEFVVAGLFYDLTRQVSFALDHQRLAPTGGSATLPRRTWFLHAVANF